MTKRKFCSALLAAVMVCGISGCAKEESSTSTSVVQSTPKNVSESESSLSISVSEISAVSSNLSKDMLSPSFEVELIGQTICLPCKVKDINGIKIDMEYSFGSYQRDDGKYMSFAYYYYNDIRAGQIYLDGDCTGKTDLDEEKVIGLSLKENSVPMSYMGLTCDSGWSDIVSILGEPDHGLTYYIEPEGSVSFSLNSKDKVKEIWLYTDLR